MDNDTARLLDRDPALGYSRVTVDEFAAAMDHERSRLTAAIEEADARHARARAAISAHDVMLTMLLEAHEAVAARKHDGEREAASILEAADREARDLIELASGRRPLVAAPGAEPVGGSPVSIGALDAHDRVIDLAQPEPVAVPAPVFAMPNGSGNGHDSGSSDRYFDFLRGALADDEPLGPRSA